MLRREILCSVGIKVKFHKFFFLQIEINPEFFFQCRLSCFFVFIGIQGFQSRLDKNGDAEGNYTVLFRVPYRSDYTNYSMRPVGHFEVSPQDHTLVSTIWSISNIHPPLRWTASELFLIACQATRYLICVNVLHS